MVEHVDDQDLAVAGIYASSLLELAARRGREEAILAELEEVVALLADDPAFGAYLSNPTVPFERRRETVERIFRGRVDDLVVNTLHVMNKRDRLGIVPALAVAYRETLDERQGREHVEVTTAVPLTAVLRERLQAAAERLSGRTVRLVESVDEALLGGLVLQIGDEKIDTSVTRSLALLGERLAERSSHELQGVERYVTAVDATE